MNGPPHDEGRPGEERPFNVVSPDSSIVAHARPQRMRRRAIKVTFTDTPLCVYVTGQGSRELLTSLRGRPPVYATRHRAWTTTAATARDLVAFAELNDYDVTVLGGGQP